MITNRESYDFAKSALIDRKIKRQGVELVRYFFRGEKGGGATHADRRAKPWTSRNMARAMAVPMGDVNAALREARELGLVELGEEGWRWVG